MKDSVRFSLLALILLFVILANFIPPGSTYAASPNPTIATNAATNITATGARLNAHLISTGDRSTVTYIWFGWDTVSVPVTPSDNTSVYTIYPHYFIAIGPYSSGDDFWGNTSGDPISPGTRYYFRPGATNGYPPQGGFPQDRWTFGDEMSFLTKPLEPSNLNRTIVSNSQIDFTWTKGTGANRTKLLRKTGDYPSNYDDADATEVYFGTGTSCSDTGLSIDTTLYYYRAWSEITDGSDQQWSSSYAQITSFNRPTVATTDSFNVSSTTFWIHGNITDLGGQNCDKRGAYFGTNSRPDPGNTDASGYNKGGGWSGGSFGTGIFQTQAQHPEIGPGIKYYFRVCAHNMAGWSWGDELAVITRPGAPTNLIATAASPTQISLTWNKGTGSLNTKILRKTGGYPANENDGTSVYFSTGTSCQDTGLSPGVTYYYCAYAEQNDFSGGGSLQSFCSTAPQATATTLTYTPTATVPSTTGTGNVVFTTSNGSILNLTASANTPCGSISSVSFPHGFFSFTVNYIPIGSSVTITITLPSDTPTDTQYWKCINGRWVNVTSLLGDNDGDNVLTLTIKDGGLGDADGQVDGKIVDPGGPGIPTATASVSVPVPVPATEQAEGSSYGEGRSTILRSADMKARYLTVTPQQAYANQPVIIATNVINSGGGIGTYTVSLKINDKVEQTKMVSVGGGSAQQVKFTVYKAKPGSYTVAIGSEKSTFTILSADQVASSPQDSIFVLLIFGALVLASLVVLMFAFRRPSQ